MESFQTRIAYLASRLRSQPWEVRVVHMRRKWASCSASGRICFAQDLLERTKAEHEYFIVHDLLHLRHSNRGPV
ncbi:MAG: M48 family metallopeptidase [Gemmatimonadaceae bacterium]|nr:M48 family metallopeptidase [Gemmatimonadaceae bacterium]